MIKTLKPVGNSLGLIIDRPILDLLKIDQTTQLEITVSPDGRGLTIRPVDADSAGHRDRVRESASRMMDAHDEAFKTLAE